MAGLTANHARDSAGWHGAARRPSLHFAVAWVATLVSPALCAYGVWNQRQESIRVSELGVHNSAPLLAEQIEHQFDRADALLRSLAHRYAQAARLGTEVRHDVTTQSLVKRIGIVDRDGQVIFNTGVVTLCTADLAQVVRVPAGNPAAGGTGNRNVAQGVRERMRDHPGLDRFSLKADDKKLELIVDTDHLPQRLLGDPTRLTQVLINLLGNAVKFTDTGWVRLRGERVTEDDTSLMARFTVQDTGPGIPLEQQCRLFDAFEQGDTSTTRLHGGTGLGPGLDVPLCAVDGRQRRARQRTRRRQQLLVHGQAG